jgi:NAD(P)-dependent dehydrogenase (short-subunit alcohol dehydrogenase family)
MYSELQNRVAIVSGAGGNLGKAVVTRLFAEGCRIAPIDRHQENLNALCAALKATPENLFPGSVDLTRYEAVAEFVDSVVAHFGRIDILANLAGGFVFSGATHEMDLGDLDRMVEINLKTAFLLSAAVAKRMVAQGGSGRIVNIGTRGALKGEAGMSAYAASKAGVLRLTESMAAELLPLGITVNAVLPSVIDTPQNRAAMPQSDFSKWVAPESLADAIAFLVSDAARDISGAAIPVYGRS